MVKLCSEWLNEVMLETTMEGTIRDKKGSYEASKGTIGDKEGSYEAMKVTR